MAATVSLGRCKQIRETRDAVLVEPCKGNRDTFAHTKNGQAWIPKSVLGDENEVNEFERGECFVAEWWAEREGFA